MVVKIYIEGVQLDLFQDEQIELTSTIANTDDISKINSDYTKSFTVPASDNNNYIFKHFYDADIDNTFDARTKKNASIELDGLPFRVGKMRLEKVSVKSGKPSSYTVNFWGDLVNFKDLIGSDELSTLDLSAYNHVYNSANVRTGLEVGLFNGDIVYNLLSTRKQYLYNSDATDNTNSEKLVNIAYNGQNRGVNWNDLKPSIRLKAIIEAIEAKYNFTFSRQFIDRTEFKEAYLWVKSDTKGENNAQRIEIDFTSGSPNLMDYATNTLTVDRRQGKQYFGVRINPEPGYTNVPYRIVITLNGEDFV